MASMAALTSFYPLLLIGIVGIGIGNATNLSARYAAADLATDDDRSEVTLDRIPLLPLVQVRQVVGADDDAEVVLVASGTMGRTSRSTTSQRQPSPSQRAPTDST